MPWKSPGEYHLPKEQSSTRTRHKSAPEEAYRVGIGIKSGQCTSISVPIFTKLMGLPRIEDPSWACPSAMPDGHGIVEEDFPRGKEDGSHVVIPCLYHLAKFPKLINIGWGLVLVNVSS